MVTTGYGCVSSLYCFNMLSVMVFCILPNSLLNSHVKERISLQTVEYREKQKEKNKKIAHLHTVKFKIHSNIYKCF